MKLERLIVPALLIVAITGIIYRATRPTPPVGDLSNEVISTSSDSGIEMTGMLTYGNEVRAFVPCGVSERDAAWMAFGDPAVSTQVRTTYEAATSDRIPYTPVLATITAEPIEPLTEGFGAEYNQALLVHSVNSINADNTCLYDEINVTQPLPGSAINSPLTIEGVARGTWMFEGSMNAILTNWDGEIIAEGTITTEEDWMTENFVPFRGELEFDTPQYGETGNLIIQSANPSGLPENDKAYEIIVEFSPDEIPAD